MADEDLIQTSGEDIHHNEPLLQVGRGQKRSVDEVNDGAGTSDEVSGNNVFTMTDAKQVTVKNFSTACMDYTVQFTDTIMIKSVLCCECPISLLFFPPSRLTTARVVSETRRVIQSNCEFRLNDSVKVNLIHVEMPNSGSGKKTSAKLILKSI